MCRMCTDELQQTANGSKLRSGETMQVVVVVVVDDVDEKSRGIETSAFNQTHAGDGTCLAHFSSSRFVCVSMETTTTAANAFRMACARASSLIDARASTICAWCSYTIHILHIVDDETTICLCADVVRVLLMGKRYAHVRTCDRSFLHAEFRRICSACRNASEAVTATCVGIMRFFCVDMCANTQKKFV